MKNCALEGKTRPQLRGRIRKQQHSHHTSGGGAARFSALLIRATGRRGGPKNRVVRGMFMAKDTVIVQSSSHYCNKQTKTREGGGQGTQKALLPRFHQASPACKTSSWQGRFSPSHVWAWALSASSHRVPYSNLCPQACWPLNSKSIFQPSWRRPAFDQGV